MWTPLRLPACALLLALGLSSGGCGPDAAASPDPFNGAIDATVLDVKLLPSTDRKLCPSGNCYPGQQGYAHGQAVFFYNLGTAPGTPLAASLARPVFAFSDCKPNAEFDAQRDAYPRDQQFPIFSALPLASTQANAVVLPLARLTPVTGAQGSTCNDLKDDRSIGSEDGASAGHLGAKAAAPTDVVLWAVVDRFGAALNPGSPALTAELQPGWYRGLALGYLDGGKVAVDASGNLVAMDGVILNPAAPAAPSKATDAKVILLPFVPGEAGYSPLVRLHTFTLPAGKTPGSYTGLCAGTGCAATDVDLTLATKAASSTLFIVANAP